jgi:hypothetical protein
VEFDELVFGFVGLLKSVLPFGGGKRDRLIRAVGLVSRLRCVGRFRLYLRGSGGGSHGVRLQGHPKS